MTTVQSIGDGAMTTAASSEVQPNDDVDQAIGTRGNAHSHHHGETSSNAVDSDADGAAAISLLRDIVKIRTTSSESLIVQSQTTNSRNRSSSAITIMPAPKAERISRDLSASSSTSSSSSSRPGSYAVSALAEGRNNNDDSSDCDDDDDKDIYATSDDYEMQSIDESSLCVAQSITAATLASEREMIYKEVMESFTANGQVIVVANVVGNDEGDKKVQQQGNKTYNQLCRRQWQYMALAVIFGIAAMVMVGVLLLSVVVQPRSKSTGTTAPTIQTMVPPSHEIMKKQDDGVFYTTEELYAAVDAYLIALKTSTTPETSNVALRYGYPMNTWNVSLLSNFARVFDPSRSSTTLDPTNEPPVYPSNMSPMNEDLSKWDVSNAVTMMGMFAYATEFQGVGIDHWDTSNVQDMSYMFFFASSFNNTDLGKWNTSRVLSMESTFDNAESFSGDISMWDVASVTTMSAMFYNAVQFTGTNLHLWDVSNVQDMNRMFYQAELFTGNVSGWNTSQVTNMGLMFMNAYSFNADLSSWSVGNVVDMSFMLSTPSFAGDWNLSNWDTSRVTTMVAIFHQAEWFTGNVSTWDVSKVVDMDAAFSGCTHFNGDLSKWDTSRVKTMTSMFSDASTFASDLSRWNTSGVTSMKEMFMGAKSFNRDISMWDVSSVTDATGMFSSAASFHHSLCLWQKRLPVACDVTRMFTGSACTNDNDPVLFMKSTDTSFCEPC